MQSPGNQRTNTPSRMLISPASSLHGISILLLLQVLQKHQPQEAQLGPPDSPLGGQCMAVLRPPLARLMSKLFLRLWYVFSPWEAPPRWDQPSCRCRHTAGRHLQGRTPTGASASTLNSAWPRAHLAPNLLFALPQAMLFQAKNLRADFYPARFLHPAIHQAQLILPFELAYIRFSLTGPSPFPLPSLGLRGSSLA